MNAASEETRETVKRCSELYGNIQRMAEKIIPLKGIGILMIFFMSLLFMSFKSTSNRMDNPTELTRADVNAVVFTLITNSSRMISDNIEGEDRFGKQNAWSTCAELKLWVIDLEAYGESYGDRAQAEHFALAA